MNILLTYLLILFVFFTFTEKVCAADFSVPEDAYTPIQKNNPQNNKSPRLSEIAYRQFQPIQKQISAEKYDQALNALNLLAKRYQNKPYVVSVAMNSAAYIFIAQEAYPKAITWMTRTLELSAMSTAELQKIRHDLSQLQLQAEQYQNTANTMNSWLKVAKPSEISVADYQLLAISEFHLEHYQASKHAVKKGLALSKQASEPLYRLLLSCDLALKNYQSANKTLTTLVKLNPDKKNYWQQLAGIYDVLEQPKNALAIFELMAQRTMLNSEAERIQYIQRLIHQNNSFKAANQLSQYIKTSKVKGSTDNSLLLADAWERSGENRQALQQLKNLPPQQTLSRLVRIYANTQQWQNLTTVLESQLSNPITTNNASLFLQLGYALNKLGEFDKASQVFSKLANAKEISKETSKSANDWLNYLATH
jgi:hypothetical protein